MIHLDLTATPPVVVVGDARLDADAVKKLLNELESARVSLLQEARRREAFANRERLVAEFRTHPTWRDSLVETTLDGRRVLLALYFAIGQVWPIGIDPATGLRLDGLQFAKIPESPWEPLWLRRTPAGKAHRWTGGALWTCGERMPWLDPRQAFRVAGGYDAADPRLSLTPAEKCRKCGGGG